MLIVTALRGPPGPCSRVLAATDEPASASSLRPQTAVIVLTPGDPARPAPSVQGVKSKFAASAVLLIQGYRVGQQAWQPARTGEQVHEEFTPRRPLARFASRLHDEECRSFSPVLHSLAVGEFFEGVKPRRGRWGRLTGPPNRMLLPHSALLVLPAAPRTLMASSMARKTDAMPSTRFFCSTPERPSHLVDGSSVDLAR
jgi:hypothetical protein